MTNPHCPMSPTERALIRRRAHWHGRLHGRSCARRAAGHGFRARLCPISAVSPLFLYGDPHPERFMRHHHHHVPSPQHIPARRRVGDAATVASLRCSRPRCAKGPTAAVGRVCRRSTPSCRFIGDDQPAVPHSHRFEPHGNLVDRRQPRELLLLHFGPEPLVLLVDDARRRWARQDARPTRGMSKFAPNRGVLPMEASFRCEGDPCDTTTTSHVVTDPPQPAGAVPIAEHTRRTETGTTVGLGTGQGGGPRGSLP